MREVGALSVLLGIVVSVAFVDPMHKGEALDDEDHVRFEASRLIRCASTCAQCSRTICGVA